METSQKEADFTAPEGICAILKAKKGVSASVGKRTSKTTGVIFLTIHVRQNLKISV